VTNTFLGIALETWVNIDEDCPVECETSRTEAQIALGHGTGSLHLVLSEGALRKLAGVLTEAGVAMRPVEVVGGR
jgi:hypothetical protein